MADLPIIVVSTESIWSGSRAFGRKSRIRAPSPSLQRCFGKTVLQLTGVSNEQLSREDSLSEGGPDFEELGFMMPRSDTVEISQPIALAPSSILKVRSPAVCWYL